jgi:hypothetical protein
MSQFERLPFVRSLFFRYGLRFTDPHIQSVIQTADSGAATVAIEMSRAANQNLIFHYNLRFYDTDETEVDGLSLKRFVMQSTTANSVVFRFVACTELFLYKL